MRENTCTALPKLEQTAVIPIPDEIEHELSTSAGRVGHGNAITRTDQNMLERRKTHLHLGHDIPVGPGAAAQLLAAHEFDCRCPGTAIAALFGEGFPKAHIEPHFLNQILAKRESSEELALKHEIVGQCLAEQSVGLKRHGASAEAPFLAP